MFTKSTHEEDIVRTEKKLQELTLEFESMNQKIEALFDDLSLSSEAVSHFCSSEENFESSTWAQLNEEKARLHANLEKRLAQFQNPKELQNKYATLNIASHWIPVR